MIYRQIVLEEGSVKLANLITLSRGLAILPIMLLASYKYLGFAIVLYLAASLSDVLDGWIARRSGRASAFGASLDAIVDNIFSVAILVFIALSYPGLAARHVTALTALFGVPLLYLLVSWLLTRKLLMFHFWSAKAGALLLFALWPLIFFTGWEDAVSIAATIVVLSRFEQILFILRGGVNLDAPHMFSPIGAS